MNSAFWLGFVLRLLEVLIPRMQEQAVRRVKISCNDRLLQLLTQKGVEKVEVSKLES